MIGLARWLALVPQFDEGAETPARELFQAWSRYAQKRRFSPGTPRSFSLALRKVGCCVDRKCGRRTRYHRGIRLPLPAWAPDWEEVRAINDQGREESTGYRPTTHRAPDGTWLGRPVPLRCVTKGLREKWEPVILRGANLRWREVPARWVRRGDHWALQEIEE